MTEGGLGSGDRSAGPLDNARGGASVTAGMVSLVLSGLLGLDVGLALMCRRGEVLVPVSRGSSSSGLNVNHMQVSTYDMPVPGW